MGTNLNFKNSGNMPPADGGRPPPINYPLARQSSVYSLTFDEFQNTMGGVGKDFGSMNMDELLKNIWSADEIQNTASVSDRGCGVIEAGISGGHLNKQGSLTLPRTLSQRTVDDVWREMLKDYDETKDGSGIGRSNVSTRQQTLGEMTLEEFLVKAGAVREDAHLAEKSDNALFFGNLTQPVNNPPGLEVGFRHMGQIQNIGHMSKRIPENNNEISVHSPNLPLNAKGVSSSQRQLPPSQAQPQQQPLIFPKQPALAYGAAMPMPSSTQLGARGIGVGVAGTRNGAISGSMVQGTGLGGGMGMANLGATAVSVAIGSPAMSSDGLAKGGADTSSVSPVPYALNGGLRGRKCTGMEKVIERRQRRMIKNRESAARSRARKQAYTMELEAEVSKLKEENEELQQKQEKIVELMKKQVTETMDPPRNGKRRCLRRTHTSVW